MRVNRGNLSRLRLGKKKKKSGLSPKQEWKVSTNEDGELVAENTKTGMQIFIQTKEN